MKLVPSNLVTYGSLSHGMSLSVFPFFLGAAIMIMSLVLFENEFLNIVAISFTSLILNELIMVALEITTWWVSRSKERGGKNTPPLSNVINGNNRETQNNMNLNHLVLPVQNRHIYMVISEVVTLFFYVVSIAFLPEFFGTPFIMEFSTPRKLIKKTLGALFVLLSLSPSVFLL